MPYSLKQRPKPTSLLPKGTLSNADRLLADAKLLTNNGRHKSAIILAVFALEELGKALIWHWGVRNEASKREFPTHVEKQSAAFALLSSMEIIRSDRKRLRRHLNNGTLNFLKIGELSHQFAWARKGFYDDLRMSATYADKDPKIPGELIEQSEEGLAKELLNYFDMAVLASSHAGAMDFASEIYRNGLGRL